ncbi:MAG: DUF697 domain-containing protein [Coriobacteriales bacterium]|nr:DUF697 domain-containing protein [Coriobacteriales bacterium]
MDKPVDTPALPAPQAPAPTTPTVQRKSNTGTYVVLGCVAALLALSLLGSLLNVGDHLTAAHPALGWVFYGLIAVLVIVGVVVPMIKIARRPIFSLYQLHDEQGHAKQRWCQLLADNLIANANLNDQEVLEVQAALQAGDQADDQLIELFKRHCIPLIDEQTKHAATTAFLIAAISRSPLISTVTMLSICFDLVSGIVQSCGFRPTNLGLARLYTRVMISALIIGGIEDADLGDLLGQLMGGGAGARVGGFFIGATAEGLVSAFLVFRVGVICKKWLTATDGPARMSQLRRSSYREALAQMRTSGFMTTVAETVKDTGSSVASSMANSVAGAARNAAEQVRTQAHAHAESARAVFRSMMSRGERADRSETGDDASDTPNKRTASDRVVVTPAGDER